MIHYFVGCDQAQLGIEVVDTCGLDVTCFSFLNISLIY